MKDRGHTVMDPESWGYDPWELAPTSHAQRNMTIQRDVAELIGSGGLVVTPNYMQYPEAIAMIAIANAMRKPVVFITKKELDALQKEEA